LSRQKTKTISVGMINGYIDGIENGCKLKVH